VNSFRRRPFRAGFATVCSLSAVGVALHTSDYTLNDSSPDTASNLTLLRSYLVWTVLGLPSIVNASPKLLDFALNTKIPLIPTIAENVVRGTFFAQFIPGETAGECAPTIENLRRQNIGSALNYSAEADAREEVEESVLQTRRYDEIERAIAVQGRIEREMQREGWRQGSAAFAVKVVSSIQQQATVGAESIRAVSSISMSCVGRLRSSSLDK
jgi:proline dehydrogenase